ncbi:hypothetical protein Bca4012_102591 [Brassica carinata]
MSSAGSTAASLGSKRRGCYPLRFTDRIPLVRTSSELAVRRRRNSRESCSQSVPGRHATRALSRVSSSSSPPTVDGFELGSSSPALEPILFRLRIHFADFLAYIVPSTRGCSPWRPDAVMSTTGVSGTRSSGFSRARECTDTTRRAICTDGRSARARALGFAATARPPTHRGLALAPTAGIGRALQRHPFSGLVDSAEFPLAARSGIVHHLSGPDSACSHSNPSRKIKVGRWCTREDPTNQLPYALRVYSPADSHTCQTPWSVFQDGSNGEPTGRRPSTQMPRHAVARAADHD